MRIRLCFLLAAACLSLPQRASGQIWNPVPAKSDDFNGAANSPIDSTKWTFDLGNNNGWGNNELEIYCGPPGTQNNPSACDPNNPNVFIDGSGHLVIQALKINNTLAAGSWTSTRMNTNTNPTQTTFQYGRIEAREQLPVGAGLWPAFWALGSNFATVPWPGCGEMDFMENVPAGPPGNLGPTLIRSTIHGPGYSGANGLGQNFTFPNGSDVTSFHIYGAIWSPNMVQFYVDDPTQPFFIRTASDVPGGSAQWVYNHSFIAITNLAVGGNYPGNPSTTTPSPAVMLVDYVHYYQATPVAAPTFANPPSITVKAGATSNNTSIVGLSSMIGTGRVYLACSTTAPQATCAINTGYALNSNVVDFTVNPTATATVSVNTTANSIMPPAVFDLRMRFSLPIVLAALLVLVLTLFLVRTRRATPQLEITGLNRRTSSSMRNWAGAAALATLALAGVIMVSCGGGGTPPCGSGGLACPTPANGTTPGNYTITVNAYTVSNSGANPDASVNVSLTVQ